jgi:nucleoside-diphosphate-sugar epimerase
LVFKKGSLQILKTMNIGVIGAGWIGFPLAKSLAQDGHCVKGSVTNREKFALLEEGGIEPIELKLVPEASNLIGLKYLLEADIVVIAIPPSRHADGTSDFHARQIRTILEALPANFSGKILYTSATSVYPETNGEVDENSPLIEGHQLVLAEAELSKLHCPTTILRLGGLMGYARMAGKYVAGKKDVTVGDVPVNFVHGDDVVRAAKAVIDQGRWGEIYNVVAPKHPIRKEIYNRNCQDFGLELPTYAENPHFSYKIVLAHKIQQELQFDYLYPDPLEFPYQFD